MIYPLNFEQKIGFDHVRQLLKGECLSPLGIEKVEDMDFSGDFNIINCRLDQVVEFMRILQEEDDFPCQYFFDVRPSLRRIKVEGMYMDENSSTYAVRLRRYVISSAFCSRPVTKARKIMTAFLIRL